MSILTLDARTTFMSFSGGEVAMFNLLLHIHGFAHDRPVRRQQEQRAGLNGAGSLSGAQSHRSKGGSNEDNRIFPFLIQLLATE
jgi:hypothetical protein